MTLPAARKRAWAGQFLGGALMALALFGLLLSLSKLVYVSRPTDFFIFAIPKRGIDRVVETIFQGPSLASLVWDVIPIPDFINLITVGNGGYILLLCGVGWGTSLYDGAQHLQCRIRNIEADLEADQGSNTLGDGETTATMSAVAIQLEPRDQWSKRPLGVVSLGVMIPVLSALLVHLLLQR
jgi:hypothetical protein